MRSRVLTLLVALALVLAAAPPSAIAEAAGGFGVLGDSSSDEFRAEDNRGGAYAATTLNWVELLVRYRGLDFGAWATRDEPRRTGYEYNWARSGARAADLIAQGQAVGLAQQVAEGRVSSAVLMIGANDFALTNNTYAEIYSGAVSGAALTAKIDGIVASIALALDIVRAAGPVQFLVVNIPALDAGPALQGSFPDPARRQLVTNAILAVNAGIASVTAQRGIPVVDLDAFAVALLSQVDANGNVNIGGELLNLLVGGDEPHHALLADNHHGGTVSEGMLANHFLDHFAAAGGPTIARFTDQELLANAGILSADVTPPTVSIRLPLNGAVVSGSVAVTADVSDDRGVLGVQFLVDGVLLGSEVTVAPYARTWNAAGAVPGPHVLRAVARDAAGNAAAAQVTVTVADTAPPTVALTAPAGGSVVSGTVTIRASAADNVGVVGVWFKLDGNSLGAESTIAPYSIAWNTTTAANGPHVLTATARDAAGNTTTATVTVNVLNPLILYPSSYVIASGSYQAGDLQSLVADDGNHLIIRSTTTGVERTAHAEFVISGVVGPVTRLDFRAILRSSASSTSVRFYIYDFTARAWIQLNASMVGMTEVTRNVSVSANTKRYVDAAGTVRLRIQSGQRFPTYALSVEMLRLTVPP